MDTAQTEFGHWTTVEERLAELRNRLVAWVLTSEHGFGDIWSEAKSRFELAVSLAPNPYELEDTSLIECFEEVLADYDSIWVESQKLALKLGMMKETGDEPC